MLWSSFAACAALAIWQTSDAIFDFEHLPAKKKAAKKAKAVLQAVVYAGLAVTLASFCHRGGQRPHPVDERPQSIAVMNAPGGFSAPDRRRCGNRRRRNCLRHPGLPAVVRQAPAAPRLAAKARTAVTVLGVVGYAAKGIALLLAGLLIIIATIKAHPEESTGLDGGLKGLRDQPFGMYMLAAVGIGLICYGIFMMVRAKLAKM